MRGARPSTVPLVGRDVERVPDVADDAGSRMVQFGTNEWLVDEIYQQYLKELDERQPAPAPTTDPAPPAA